MLKKLALGIFAALMIQGGAYAVEDIDATTPFSAERNWDATKNTILPKVDDMVISVPLENVSTASSAWVAATVTGRIVGVWATVSGQITVAPARLRFEINDQQLEVGPQTASNHDGTLDLAFNAPAGSRVLYSGTHVLKVLAKVTPGSVLQVGTDGLSTTDVDAIVTWIIQRYP
tara:strand:+ start:2249 stop:2770 length:522 start_codon:yes stop_codon:yes gene_type:complete